MNTQQAFTDLINALEVERYDQTWWLTPDMVQPATAHKRREEQIAAQRAAARRNQLHLLQGGAA